MSPKASRRAIDDEEVDDVLGNDASMTLDDLGALLSESEGTDLLDLQETLLSIHNNDLRSR